MTDREREGERERGSERRKTETPRETERDPRAMKRRLTAGHRGRCKMPGCVKKHALNCWREINSSRRLIQVDAQMPDTSDSKVVVSQAGEAIHPRTSA